MTTTRKKKTTKTKKVEAVVDHDGHDVVEEVKEPELPPSFKHTMVYVNKRLATRDRVDPVGQLGFSDKQNSVIFSAYYAYQNEMEGIVHTSYSVDGILFAPLTRDWWDNLPKSSIIPLSWVIDFNNKTVMDEV